MVERFGQTVQSGRAGGGSVYKGSLYAEIAAAQIRMTGGVARGRLLLTPKGKRLLASAVPIWEWTHKEIEGLLPDGDPSHLRSDLRVLSGGG
jgi:hypothetical protein